MQNNSWLLIWALSLLLMFFVSTPSVRLDEMSHEMYETLDLLAWIAVPTVLWAAWYMTEVYLPVRRASRKAKQVEDNSPYTY